MIFNYVNYGLVLQTVYLLKDICLLPLQVIFIVDNE